MVVDQKEAINCDFVRDIITKLVLRTKKLVFVNKQKPKLKRVKKNFACITFAIFFMQYEKRYVT